MLDLPAFEERFPDLEAVRADKKRLGADYGLHLKKHGTPMRTVIRSPTAPYVEVQLFEQLWGSTALGYGGLGGAAMTYAYTVLVSGQDCICVYFGGGKLGYRLTPSEMTQVQAETWVADLQNREILGRRDAAKSYGAQLPG